MPPPCYIVIRPPFTTPLLGNLPLWVAKVGMGGAHGRADSRTRFLNETIRFIFKVPVADPAKEEVLPEDTRGSPGNYYTLQGFTATSEWKTTEWPQVKAMEGAGPEWLQIPIPPWGRFMLNEKRQIVPRQGKEAARLRR